MSEISKFTKNTNQLNNTNIVFFDGYCNLCNGFVDHIIRYDHHHLFKFAPLSGETAKAYQIQQPTDLSLQTVVLMTDKGKQYEKSTAALYILSKIHPIPILFNILRLVPLTLRDRIYRWVAQNRYRLFGSKDTCRMPTPEERSKFLP